MFGSISWPSYWMGIKPSYSFTSEPGPSLPSSTGRQELSNSRELPLSPALRARHPSLHAHTWEPLERTWSRQTSFEWQAHSSEREIEGKNHQSYGSWQFFSLLLEPDHCILQLLYPAWCCLHIALGTILSLSFIQPNVCQKNYQWELMLFAFNTWNEWLIVSDIIYLRLGNPAKVPNSLLSIHFFHIMPVFQIASQSKNMIAWWFSSFIPILELCKKLHCTVQFWSISHGFVSIQGKTTSVSVG